MAAEPMEVLPDGRALYLCNPVLNTKCRKSFCFWLGRGECKCTFNSDFALERKRKQYEQQISNVKDRGHDQM